MYRAQPQDQNCFVPPIEHNLNRNGGNILQSHGVCSYYYNNNIMTSTTVGTAAFIPIAAQYNNFQRLGQQNMQFSIPSSNVDSSGGYYQHYPMQFPSISTASPNGESSGGHFQHYPMHFPSNITTEEISNGVMDQFSSHSSHGMCSEGIEYYQTQCSSSDEVVEQFSSSSSNGGCSNDFIEYYQLKRPNETAVEVLEHPSTNGTNVVSNDEVKEEQFSSNSSNGGGSNDIIEYYQLKCPSNTAVEVDTQKLLEHPSSNGTNVVSNGEVKKDSNSNNIFRCDPCGRIFKSMGYLKQHNNSRHAGHLHKCSKCNKSFPTEEYLEAHFSKHSGQKPFPCDKCDKGFHHRSDLRRHYRLHTQNLFFCLTCGKGFSRKTHQEAHQQIHLKRVDSTSSKVVTESKK